MAASGQEMSHYGKKQVKFKRRDECTNIMSLDFQVYLGIRTVSGEKIVGTAGDVWRARARCSADPQERGGVRKRRMLLEARRGMHRRATQRQTGHPFGSSWARG